MRKILGIEVTEEEEDFLFCEQAKGKEIKVIDGKVVAVEKTITDEEKIAEFKNLLSKTDYQAIKFAEGELSAEEYEPIRLQRKAWREEINMLEGGKNE